MNHLALIVVAAIVLLTPSLVGIGFLVWAAIRDGRDQGQREKVDRWR